MRVEVTFWTNEPFSEDLVFDLSEKLPYLGVTGSVDRDFKRATLLFHVPPSRKPFLSEIEEVVLAHLTYYGVTVGDIVTSGFSDEDDSLTFDSVTRITVVTDEGREFEKYNAYNNGVYLKLQDDGRTLKIFPRKD